MVSRSQKLRNLFAEPFEPAASGFVYRRSEGAAGIAVGAAEHAAFVAAFERQMPWLRWVCEPYLVLIVGFVAAGAAFELTRSQWLGLLALGAPYVIAGLCCTCLCERLGGR